MGFYVWGIYARQGIFVVMAINNYLFVYGTLLNAGNEFAIYLNNCSFYADGRFKGRLYDMGEYPGAISDNCYAGYVYGSVFKMNDGISALRYLDNYEGYGPEQEQPNLFIRQMIDIESGSEIVPCWVYTYNLPTDNFPQIPSGRYSQDL